MGSGLGGVAAERRVSLTAGTDAGPESRAPQVTFSWEVNVGQIVTLVSFLLGIYGMAVRLYHMLDLRMMKFEQTLNHHAQTLEMHATRMDRHEERLIRIFAERRPYDPSSE